MSERMADPMPAPSAGAGERQQQPNGAVSFAETARRVTELGLRRIDQRAMSLGRAAPHMLNLLERLTVLCLQDERYLHDAEFHAAVYEARILVQQFATPPAGYQPTPEPEPQG